MWSCFELAIYFAYRHIGILHIKCDCTFKIDPIRLKSVRPFIIESTRLQGTGIHVSDEDAVYAFLTDKVKSLIDKVKSENPDSSKIPLVRLKVSYKGYRWDVNLWR